MLRAKTPTLLLVLSLAAFLIVLSACVVSWFRTDFLYYGFQSGRVVGIDSGASWIAFTVDHTDPRFSQKGLHHTSKPEPFKPVFSTARSIWQRLGFWSIQFKTNSSGFGHRWVVPYWSILLLLLTPSGWNLRRWVRASWRVHAGFCKTCGYDLRATPDRCPECGAAVVPSDIKTG